MQIILEISRWSSWLENIGSAPQRTTQTQLASRKTPIYSNVCTFVSRNFVLYFFYLHKYTHLVYAIHAIYMERGTDNRIHSEVKYATNDLTIIRDSYILLLFFLLFSNRTFGAIWTLQLRKTSFYVISGDVRTFFSVFHNFSAGIYEYFVFWSAGATYATQNH